MNANLSFVLLKASPGCLRHVVWAQVNATVLRNDPLVATRAHNPLWVVQIEVQFLLGCLLPAEALLGKNSVPKLGLHNDTRSISHSQMAVFDMLLSREQDADMLQHVCSGFICEARVQILQSFELQRPNTWGLEYELFGNWLLFRIDEYWRLWVANLLQPT